MKKIAIVLFVASAALAGCTKKKAPAAPATTTEPAAGSADGSAAGSDGSAAPAEGGSAM